MFKNALPMVTLRLLLLSAFFMLSACSAVSPSDLSRLSPGPDGEYLGWHCDWVIEKSDDWRCSETLLKDGLVVAGSAAQVEVEALEVGSSETTAAVEQVVNAKATVNKTLVQKLPLKKDPDTRFPKFDISATGYTVQLGAYLSQALAERAADNMILPGGELRIRDIVTAERRFFVLVYGRYQTRQQAEVASEPLVVLNSGLNYWIRSIASMRKRD